MDKGSAVAGVGRGAVVPEEPTWEYNMEQRDIGAKLMVQQIRRAIESGRGRFSDPDANWVVDQGMKPQPVGASPEGAEPFGGGRCGCGHTRAFHRAGGPCECHCECGGFVLAPPPSTEETPVCLKTFGCTAWGHAAPCPLYKPAPPMEEPALIQHTFAGRFFCTRLVGAPHGYRECRQISARHVQASTEEK